MYINLKYFVNINGDIPCGQNGYKSEEQLTKDLPYFKEQILELLREQLCSDMLNITVDQINDSDGE